MDLRFGWVLDTAGLLGTLLIVTISMSIAFLTALSIGALATDQRVRIGRACYLISRWLGIEIGGDSLRPVGAAREVHGETCMSFASGVLSDERPVAPKTQQDPLRELGFWDANTIGVGTMSGDGTFLLPDVAAIFSSRAAGTSRPFCLDSQRGDRPGRLLGAHGAPQRSRHSLGPGRRRREAPHEIREFYTVPQRTGDGHE